MRRLAPLGCSDVGRGYGNEQDCCHQGKPHIGPDAGAKLGTRFFHIPLLILMSTLFVLFPTVGVAFSSLFLEYLALTWPAENILVARKYKSQMRGFPSFPQT